MEEKDSMAQEAVEAVDTPAASETPKPKKKKKGLIIALVIVGVVVVAAAGLWIWHEQPSFCGAICHTPMDPYQATYEAEPGTETTDKWGNEVEDACGMLASVHRADSGTTCLDCHVPVLSQQIDEAIAWLNGDYEVVSNDTYGLVLEERSLKTLAEATDTKADSFCLNESCHNMTREELAESTSDMTRNPHDTHHDNYSCDTCHKAHRASSNYCTTCHSDAETPEGWISYSEFKSLSK